MLLGMQDMQQHVALRDAASRLQGLAAEVAEARASLLERASQRIPRHVVGSHAVQPMLPCLIAMHLSWGMG